MDGQGPGNWGTPSYFGSKTMCGAIPAPLLTEGFVWLLDACPASARSSRQDASTSSTASTAERSQPQAPSPPPPSLTTCYELFCCCCCWCSCCCSCSCSCPRHRGVRGCRVFPGGWRTSFSRLAVVAITLIDCQNFTENAHVPNARIPSIKLA